MANEVHRLPLSDAELARAEQTQAQKRNVERARMEREDIERRMNAGISPQVLQAAEGGEAEYAVSRDANAAMPSMRSNTFRSASPGVEQPASGDSMDRIAEDAQTWNASIKERMNRVLGNFATSSAGSGAPFSEERKFNPEDEVSAAPPSAAPRRGAATVHRSAPPPPPLPKPRPKRRTVRPDDEDAELARSLVADIVPDGTPLDPAMKQLMKMCEAWALHAQSNSIKANREFAKSLRRNVPIFMLSPQIDIGKLNALINAVIKIDESTPQTDATDMNDELLTRARRIQEMIDQMPDVDLEYRSHLKPQDDGEDEDE